MRYFFSTYWLFIKTFFKTQAEYRAEFFFGLFANFYCFFITYSTYWVLVKGLGSIGGWDFSDLSILYGLSMITYSLSATLLWYSVYNLGEMLTKGNLDFLLKRPLGILPQLIFHRFGDTALGQILVTIIFLTVAFASKSDIMTPLKFAYFLFAVIGGCMIQAGGMIIIGAISFWTYHSEEIGDVFYYQIRSITQYPLMIFPQWIQLAVTFVFPWAFINYYPALIILDKAQKPSDYLLGMLSPVVGVVFLLISLYIFNRGLMRYSGAGH